MKTDTIIIFDFEVFRYDCLLGAIIIRNSELEVFQSWDREEHLAFYNDHQDAIWIGHNNERYDNHILQAQIKGQNAFNTSKDIIERGKRKYLTSKLNYFDLICQHFVGLKTMEAFMGKNISVTEVDFNLPRPLTEEEKRLTESYNRDDLEQTLEDFYYLQADFTLRLHVMNEFKLPAKCLHVTGTQLAEEVLGAKVTPGIETWVVKPRLYPELKLKNQTVIDFYLNEDFRAKKNAYVTLCGVEHKLGAGGIHAAQKKVHFKKALYFDVSGYYNLVMLNFDLLPRSIPEEGKKLYEFMYHEQLRLKKIDPGKRGVYKTILLSVFGAMMNEHCKFYDPYHGLLVTITGQIFLVDLLEKLEGLCIVIQSNTDGIMVDPLPDVTEEQIKAVVDEWQTRTGFVLKVETIYDIHQRDVNCYMYRDAGGEIHTLGEAVKDYGKWHWPFWKDSFNAKEPMIMPTCIVEYFMNGKLPEETVKENMRNLRMFQYICKKLSFDYLEYQENNLKDGTVKVRRLQDVDRAFALKSDWTIGMVYKRKNDGKKSKVSNLPESVFTYSNEILSEEAVEALLPKIDFDYYVSRAYERIREFVQIPNVEDIK